MFFNSLRYRFILSFLSIELLFISLIVFFNFSSIARLSHSLIDEKISTSTQLFIEMIKTPMAVYDLATLDDNANSFTKLQNIISVKIYDNSKRLISKSAANTVVSFDDVQHSGTVAGDGEKTYQVVWTPVNYKKDILGTVQIVYEITESLQTIGENRKLTFLLMAIELIISSIVAFLIGWRLTHDLSLLTGSAEIIAKNEDSKLPPVQSKILEVNILFDTLNTMQKNISERKQELLQTLEILKDDIVKLNTLEFDLKQEKNFISTIIDSANAIVAVINADGVMTKINKYGVDFTGYSQEEIGSAPYFWSRFLPPDIRDRITGIIPDAQKGILTKSYRSSWISRTGNERVFEWSNALVLNDEGLMDYIASIGVDITEQARQEALIQLQKEEFETIFHISKDPIAILDRESNFLDFNEAYIELTGFSREELLKRSCIGLSAPEDRERSIEAMKTVFEQGELENYEKMCVVKDDRNVIVNMSFSLLPDGERVLTSVKDVTESRNHERQLEHMAHYDMLTGLPNRMLNSDHLRRAMLQAVQKGKLLAVLYLDLDGFKEVNDHYGHDIGDKLLVKLASNMQKALRDGDWLARLGGDEFVVILPGLYDKIHAMAVIQRLLDAVNQSIRINDVSIQISVSIGVSFYPQSIDIDGDQIIRQADQAMYEAKQSGKNHFYIFDPDHDRIVREKHQMLKRIEQALANHEFILYYHPKINMRTNELIGVEALIRWLDPQIGLVPPLEFLPPIENHPLAVDIGEWVINEAISQIQKWRQAGLNISVSVNVGAKQLLQGNFVERLQMIIEQHDGFDPSMLQLEILETSALEDIDQAAKIISACNKLGVYFSLDDFGTGYSSLTYLKRLPVTTLKIDQGFVRDMLIDKNDLAILKGIIGLASAFDREILAEGVETYEHGQHLMALGCELAQGFGIARPMPADQLVKWYEQWRKEHRWQL